MILSIVIITLLSLSCGEAARFPPPNAERAAANAANVASQQAPPKKEKIQIVNSQFPVSARRFVAFAFTTDVPGTVSGGFVAYGGANDIDAVLVDDQNFSIF